MTNSAAYREALQRITESRCGWIGYGWLKTLITGVKSEQEAALLKSQFDRIAMERDWSFRSRMSVAVDARFKATIYDPTIASTAIPIVEAVVYERTKYVDAAEYTGTVTYIDKEHRTRRIRWNPETRHYDMIDPNEGR